VLSELWRVYFASAITSRGRRTPHSTPQNVYGPAGRGRTRVPPRRNGERAYVPGWGRGFSAARRMSWLPVGGRTAVAPVGWRIVSVGVETVLALGPVPFVTRGAITTGTRDPMPGLGRASAAAHLSCGRNPQLGPAHRRRGQQDTVTPGNPPPFRTPSWPTPVLRGGGTCVRPLAEGRLIIISAETSARLEITFRRPAADRGTIHAVRLGPRSR